jgi:hypothetical protein
MCGGSSRQSYKINTRFDAFGPLFGVPDIARDGDQNDPTGNVWQQGRDNLSVHAMRSRNVEVCRIGLCHLPTQEDPREVRINFPEAEAILAGGV